MVAVEDNDPAQIIEVMRDQGVRAEVVFFFFHTYVRVCFSLPQRFFLLVRCIFLLCVFRVSRFFSCVL